MMPEHPPIKTICKQCASYENGRLTSISKNDRVALLDGKEAYSYWCFLIPETCFECGQQVNRGWQVVMNKPVTP